MKLNFLVLSGILILGILFIPSAFAEKAVAQIRGTAEGSPLTGTVTFEETDAGLKVTGNFANAPAGKHGFHIHQNGSCADAGNAAGGHYNPDTTPHGYLPKDGFTHAHAGDFGNVEIQSDGTGTIENVIPGLTLKEGNHAVAGKAVILHEKEDDFGQPTGNAGKRIGCGIIEAEPAATA